MSSGADVSFGTSSGERGGVTFGTSSIGGGGVGGSGAKAFAPRSLMDAQPRARHEQQASLAAQQAAAAASASASHLSPAQHGRGTGMSVRAGASNVREIFAGGPSAGIPSQSLRDSPFMRAPPTAAAASASSASASASASAANLLATPSASPFTSEASPIRATPKLGGGLGTAGKQRNVLASDEEHKEDSLDASTWLQTPAAAASAASVYPSLSQPQSQPQSQQPLQPLQPPGLGFALPNPCAVTVFGYSASQAARVLARFHSFGEIVLREDGDEDLAASMCMGGGASGSVASAAAANWMHLTYRTPIAAAMALAQNGRVMCDGSLMIGVKPRAISIDEAREGATGLSQQRSSSSSIFERQARKQQQQQTDKFTAASIYASSAPQATHPSAVHKSICTKFMEYLFNW